VCATACVLFHRFYGLQSFSAHPRLLTAAACLFLAAKVEEEPRRLEDIASSWLVLRQRESSVAPASALVANKLRAGEVSGDDGAGAPAPPDAGASTRIDVKSEEHEDLQANILLAERLVLQTLCFDVQVVHPYNDSLELHRALKLYVDPQHSRELKQVVVNFLGDSFRSTLCLLYEPKVVSAAAMYLSLLKMNLQPLQTGMVSTAGRAAPRLCNWVDIIGSETGTSEAVMRTICEKIIDVYTKGYKRSGYMSKSDPAMRSSEAVELRGRVTSDDADSGVSAASASAGAAAGLHPDHEHVREASTSGMLYGNAEESYEDVWGVPSVPVRKVTVNVVQPAGTGTGTGPGTGAGTGGGVTNVSEDSPFDPPPAPPTPSPRIDQSPMPPPPPGDTPLGSSSYVGISAGSATGSADKFTSQLTHTSLEDTPVGSAVPPPPPTPPSEENARKRMKV